MKWHVRANKSVNKQRCINTKNICLCVSAHRSDWPKTEAGAFMDAPEDEVKEAQCGVQSLAGNHWQSTENARSPILCLKGVRITMFPLLGFYSMFWEDDGDGEHDEDYFCC